MEKVTDANNQASGEGQGEKVVFTPEQQDKVNSLIKEAMGRAGREARELAEKYKTQLDEQGDLVVTLKTQVDELKQGKGSKNDPDLKAEIERIKAENDNRLKETQKTLEQKAREAEEARNNLVTLRKQVAVQRSISPLNFFDPEEVYRLTSDFIRYDDERQKFIVLGDNGSERMNAAFEPMSLDEFYAEFASKKPYLVRGEMKQGAGTPSTSKAASGSKYAIEEVFGPKSDAKKASQLAKENPAEYKRLKKIAVEHGILAA